MTEFYEYQPRDAVAAQFGTEARVAYDKQALYIAITAPDPDPRKIIAPLEQRDQVNGSQDLIALHIDPVGSRKFAQIFRFTAVGALGDGLFNENTTNEDYSPNLNLRCAPPPTIKAGRPKCVFRFQPCAIPIHHQPHGAFKSCAASRVVSSTASPTPVFHAIPIASSATPNR